MAIENRNLEVGTRLVAKYKGETWTLEVLPDEEARFGFVGRRPEGKAQAYKSLSAAGSAIMGGKAVNGWRFWSIEGEAPATAEAEAKPAKAKGSGGSGKGKKTIYRVPPGPNLGEGKSRWFCVACMKGFVQDGTEPPAACPEGHPMEDLHTEEVAS